MKIACGAGRKTRYARTLGERPFGITFFKVFYTVLYIGKKKLSEQIVVKFNKISPFKLKWILSNTLLWQKIKKVSRVNTEKIVI